MESNKNVKLSKAILEMKFMKKSKEKAEKEEDDAEGQAMYSKKITDEMRKSGNIVFIDTSISKCKDLIDGRLSFGGMNPKVEKIMLEGYGKKLAEEELKKEKDVSDAELAQGYSTLVNTMSSKFQSKRNKNKKKFLKPADDD